MLASCSSGPPPQYYRLAAIPGKTIQTPPLSLRVRSIGVPQYLAQSGVPRPSDPYRFATSSTDLWAEPLAPMLQNLLAQELAQRLPQVTVLASSLVATPAQLFVEVDVLRFDPDSSGHIVLTAQVALKAASDNRFLRTQTLQSSASLAPGVTGTVAAMSSLWAEFADRLSLMIAQTASPG